MAKVLITLNTEKNKIKVEASKKVTKTLNETLENSLFESGKEANGVIGFTLLNLLNTNKQNTFDVNTDVDNDGEDVTLVTTIEGSKEELIQLLNTAIEKVKEFYGDTNEDENFDEDEDSDDEDEFENDDVFHHIVDKED